MYSSREAEGLVDFKQGGKANERKAYLHWTIIWAKRPMMMRCHDNFFLLNLLKKEKLLHAPSNDSSDRLQKLIYKLVDNLCPHSIRMLDCFILLLVKLTIRFSSRRRLLKELLQILLQAG